MVADCLHSQGSNNPCALWFVLRRRASFTCRIIGNNHTVCVETEISQMSADVVSVCRCVSLNWCLTPLWEAMQMSSSNGRRKGSTQRLTFYNENKCWIGLVKKWYIYMTLQTFWMKIFYRRISTCKFVFVDFFFFCLLTFVAWNFQMFQDLKGPFVPLVSNGWQICLQSSTSDVTWPSEFSTPYWQAKAILIPDADY